MNWLKQKEALIRTTPLLLALGLIAFNSCSNYKDGGELVDYNKSIVESVEKVSDTKNTYGENSTEYYEADAYLREIYGKAIFDKLGNSLTEEVKSDISYGNLTDEALADLYSGKIQQSDLNDLSYIQQ